LALATIEDWEIDTMDVKTAYLYRRLDHDIYMEQPNGFITKGKENLVCKLERSLYGLKQAGRQWNNEIHQTLEKSGFKRTYADARLYIKSQQEEEDDIIVIILYVDDLLIAGRNRKKIDHWKGKLAEHYQMKDLGPAKSFLGIHIQRDRKNKLLCIDQHLYIEGVLKRFQMDDSKPYTTPLSYSTKIQASKKQASPQEINRYQQIIGSLMYAAIGSRPDIAYAVNKLSKYNQNPDKSHFTATNHILHYLNKTKNKYILYQGKSNEGLATYTDADWAGDVDTRHSRSGYVTTFAKGATSWSSKEQKTTATSTTEAEYMALSYACKQTAWCRKLLSYLEEDMSKPSVIFIDNTGAYHHTIRDQTEARLKHIDISYHYSREFI
jgi:hypothetical protein